LTGRLRFWFLAITLIPLVSLAFATYQTADWVLRNEIRTRLEAIADNQAKQVEQFVENQREQAVRLSESPRLADVVQRRTRANDASELAAIQDELHSVFSQATRLFDYDDMVLTSPEGAVWHRWQGNLLDSESAAIQESPDADPLAPETPAADTLADASSEEPEGVEGRGELETITTSESGKTPWDELMPAARVRRQAVLSHGGFADSVDLPAFLIAVPVFQDDNVAALLGLKVPLDQLPDMMNQRGGLGRSGELILAAMGEEGAMIVAPTRHDPHAAFQRNLSLSSPLVQGMRRAERGEPLGATAIDYRGQETFAEWRHLPTSNLHLVAKIDAREVLAPLDYVRQWGVLLGVLAMVFVSLLAWHLAGTLSQPIESLTQAARAVALGRFSEPVEIDRDDEIGELAKTFNAMTGDMHRVLSSLREQVGARTSALLDQQERFQEMVETIRELFWIGSPDLRELTYVSPAYEGIWGRSVASLQQSPQSWIDAIHSDDRDRVLAAFGKLTDAKLSCEIDFRVMRPNGEVRWVRGRGSPILDGTGRVTRIVGIADDITERRQAEEEYRQFFEQSDSLLLIAGYDGLIKKVNPAFQQLLGYSREELQGGRFLDFVAPQDRERVELEVEEGRERGYSNDFDVKVQNRYGELRQLTVSSTTSHDGECFYVIGEDITDKQLVEQELAHSAEQLLLVNKALESKNRLLEDARQATQAAHDVNATILTDLVQAHAKLEAITQSVPDLLYMISSEGKMIWWSSKLEQITGRTYEQISEMTALDFFLEDEHDKTLSGIREAIEKGYASVELRLKTPEGLIPYEFNAVPMRSPDGELLGVAGSGRDMSERLAFEASVREAKESAEAANRAKSEFLANMSHEIRTPMNGVIGLTELALETELTDEQQQYLEGVRLSGNALLRVVDDILDFSKIEAGKLDIQSVKFPLRSTVEHAVGTLALKALEKGLQLQCDVDAGNHSILLGDPARIRQVLINLVGNAVKFTAAGEVAVQVELERESDQTAWMKFSVHDTGVGIAPEHKQAIFDAFMQVDGSTTRHFGGTGLGLTISSKLIQVMGGVLEVKSEVGKGSTFHFTLPLGIPPHDELDAPHSPETIPGITCRLGGDGDGDGDENGKSATGSHFDPLVEPVQDSLRVLVAEDNPVNQLFIGRVLEKAGHQPTIVNNGQAALEALGNQHFDTILMDVQMPVMDGFETTRRIRDSEQETVRHLPIVAMTAHAMKGDRERCLEIGMDDYVSKPIQPNQLLKVLYRVLRDEVPEMKENGGVAQDVDGSAIEAAAETSLDSPPRHQNNPPSQLSATDEEFLCELAGMFLEDSSQLMSRIRSAIDDHDAEELSLAAHTLKGSTGVFKDQASYEAAATMERVGREANWDRAEEVWSQLSESLDNLNGELTELLSRRGETIS
jgi:PAS domain S-box-containing protein